MPHTGAIEDAGGVEKKPHERRYFKDPKPGVAARSTFDMSPQAVSQTIY